MTTPPSAAPSPDAIPVAVIGCGRMGKLHARAYSQTPAARLVGCYDANPDTAAAAADQYHTRPFTNLDDLLPLVKAVSIAAPTQFHATLAEPFLKRGIACLIEKPLAKDSADARRIATLAREHGAPVQVGHIERFNPVVRAMSRLDITPRFIEVTRVSPLTFRSIDVGVVLDVMIHDIDIVLSLAKSPVARVDATGVSVIGGVEDVCNARLTFESGTVANLTASRLALKTERRLRVFSEDAYVSIDYQKKYGIVARRSGNLAAIRDAVQKIRTGEIQDLSDLNYSDLVQVEELQIDDQEPIRAEIDAFLNSVRTNTPPLVTAADGLAAVETAERIIAAIPTQELK